MVVKPITMSELHVGLVAGRHEIPVDGYVWTEAIENPLDFDDLYEQAVDWIRGVIEYDLDSEIANTFYLYLTGLTSATLSFLKAWEDYGHGLSDRLILMHFDRNSGSYVPQYWK